MRDRLGRNRTATAACLLLALIAAAAVLAPLLSSTPADDVDFSQRLLAPSPAHPFGTDDLGRDHFLRVMRGGRISLFVGAGSMLLAVLLGVFVGGVSGYREGVPGWVLMRTVDVFLAIPVFLLILFVSSLVQPGVITLCLLIGCTQWMEVARVVRAVVLATKQNDFVEAARALGVSERRILLRHVLSHTAAPVLVTSTIVLAQAVMLESAVSFLGFGMQPPTASWGGMLQSAQSFLGTAPWVAIFPGSMIFMTVLCVYVVGDFLRAALGPDANASSAP
ncbi:MAG: ABC transporter permease [Candidatus Krumholzibacteriia bacterium]